MSENDIERMQDELDEQAYDELEESSSAKKAKSSKKSARNSAKETARLKKEWEDSIVASKKVKREEFRGKVKRAMLIMLVFALIVTSIVYIMLLLMDENNVRITVSNRNTDKSISLSMDNEYWTPYLNADGPEDIWNISYDSRYDTETPLSESEVYSLLNADEFKLGEMNGEQYIAFTFMLRNNGNEDAHVDYEMTLEFDDHDLQDSVRVMWGYSLKNPIGLEEGESATNINVYASLSDSERLADNAYNVGRTAEDGYIECVAYDKEVCLDVHANDDYYYLKNYDTMLNADADTKMTAQLHGYKATTPFASDEFVFQNSLDLAKGDIMYCYLSIWIEGSDFDCTDTAIGGYCKMGLNFYAS